MKSVAALPAALAAHYATGGTTLATLWRVQRKDGSVFAFTDHDVAIRFGGITYSPSSAFDASAISTRSELNVDNLEVIGLIDDAGITEDDIEAGKWDGASVWIRRVNWRDLSMGAEILRVGEIGGIQRRSGQYVAEMRGLMQKLQTNVGRVITPTCDATLGDARCGVNLEALRVSAVVTTATSRRLLTASGLAQAAGYFDRGDVTFVDGLNAGVRMEIKQHTASGVLALQLALPYPLTPGDAFTVVPGCDKLKSTCKTKFSNVVNFRGFSFVPGQDKTLLVGGQ